MNSLIAGILFWVVMLAAAWLVRPGSRLLGITMERWNIWHRLATVLVLAALIASSSYLMTLCPMWNGEITAQLMEETKAVAVELAEEKTNADAAGTTDAAAKGREEWMKKAAQAMGASNMQIIRKVLLLEARPSLLNGAAVATITILGYSAMAGTLGGGGLGDIAIRYGHYRFQPTIMWITILVLVVLVQIMQEIGVKLAAKMDNRLN